MEQSSRPKFKSALVIGRFQPFHKGHEYLLHESLRIAGSLIIGIGSSNISNSDNPFSADERLEMIKTFIEHDNVSNSVQRIIEIEDVPDDEDWIREALKKAKKIDVVIGNNEWVNGIFRKAGYPVYEIPFLNREELEGKKIRNVIRDKKTWEYLVPEYEVELIRKLVRNKSDF